MIGCAPPCCGRGVSDVRYSRNLRLPAKLFLAHSLKCMDVQSAKPLVPRLFSSILAEVPDRSLVYGNPYMLVLYALVGLEMNFWHLGTPV